MLNVASQRVSPPPPVQPFVLLVDDHVPSLERLRLVVETAGYRCVTSTSASDALVYCDEWRPALVVTDLRMPRLDGRGLARWLKARYPATPILLLTAEDLDGQTVGTFATTFAAVLSKPLDVEPFLRLLDDFMLSDLAKPSLDLDRPVSTALPCHAHAGRIERGVAQPG